MTIEMPGTCGDCRHAKLWSEGWRDRLMNCTIRGRSIVPVYCCCSEYEPKPVPPASVTLEEAMAALRTHQVVWPADCYTGPEFRDWCSIRDALLARYDATKEG